METNNDRVHSEQGNDFVLPVGRPDAEADGASQPDRRGRVAGDRHGGRRADSGDAELSAMELRRIRDV